MLLNANMQNPVSMSSKQTLFASFPSIVNIIDNSNNNRSSRRIIVSRTLACSVGSLITLVNTMSTTSGIAVLLLLLGNPSRAINASQSVMTFGSAPEGGGDGGGLLVRPYRQSYYCHGVRDCPASCCTTLGSIVVLLAYTANAPHKVADTRSLRGRCLYEYII